MGITVSTATAEDTMNLLIVTPLILSYFGTLDACPISGEMLCNTFGGCGNDYENIIEDDAEITKEKIHKLLKEVLKIPGFTEEAFEQNWSAMARDSETVNKTQLANYIQWIMKFINLIGNTDKDADDEMKEKQSRGDDYENIIEDDAGITKEELHIHLDFLDTENLCQRKCSGLIHCKKLFCGKGKPRHKQCLEQCNKNEA